MTHAHKVASDEIQKGLSFGARVTLAIFASAFGVLMFISAPSDNNHFAFVIMGGFCILIAAACILRGRARQFVGSVIGASLFAISLWYLYGELSGGQMLSVKSSQPSVKNAVLFLLSFGVPGLVYAYKSRFGFGSAP